VAAGKGEGFIPAWRPGLFIIIFIIIFIPSPRRSD
jgi:hypothetical protein